MKLKLASLILAVLTLSCQNEDTLFIALDPSETNVRFSNNLSESEDFNILKYGYFYNGGGVAAADFNNDGLMDLYFTGNLSPNKLYFNKGEMEFEDVTEKFQVAAGDGWNTGVSIVDINQDGLLDIYVCRSAASSRSLRKNKLFINQGPEKPFKEEAQKYGLDDSGYSTQAVFFDYDRDGDLDAFILNHSTQEYAGYSKLLKDLKNTQDATFGSKLYRNDSKETNTPVFTNVTDSVGIKSNVLTFGLGLSVSDFNQDGWLDLYCSNDYNEEDYLYINKQDGTFKESIREWAAQTSLFSMGTDAADINNDGWIDLISLDMLPKPNERIKLTSGDDNYDKYKELITQGFHHQQMRNMLQINTGANKFDEKAQLYGIANTDWSWSALSADFDLDGFKDLFVTNGYARDYTNMDFLKFSSELNQNNEKLGLMEIIKAMPDIKEVNPIFKNSEGKKFEQFNENWGLNEPHISNGSVYVDLDNDGDLDLVTNNINETAGIYQNNIEKRNALKINLVGKEALKIGAKVYVYSQGLIQLQEFNPVRGFQSSSYTPLIFGTPRKVDSLKIIWSDQNEQVFQEALNGNVTLKYQEIRQKQYIENTQEERAIEIPVSFSFKNDFKQQPLLPFMLSYDAPKQAMGDLNNDGFEDLIVCGTDKWPTRIYLGNKNEVNEWKNLNLFEGFAPADAAIGDINGDGLKDVVLSKFSFYNQSFGVIALLNLGKGSFSKAFWIDQSVNAKAISLLDVDFDGDMDLLVGGYCLPSRFPEASSSKLYLNNGKGFFKEFKNGIIESLALVTDLVILPVKKQNEVRVVVTAHLNETKILSFVGGEIKSKNISPKGFWNSAGLLSMDSKEVLILGNKGINNQYALYGPKINAWLLTQGNGTTFPILALGEKKHPFFARDELLDQLPTLKPYFTNYSSYSKVTMPELLDKTRQEFTSENLGELELRSGYVNLNDGKEKFEPFETEFQMSALKYFSGTDSILFATGNTSFTDRIRVGASGSSRLLKIELSNSKPVLSFSKSITFKEAYTLYSPKKSDRVYFWYYN